MRREKMNNKGFSLVELIIVIAIMAILSAALAPQLMKYIEKSRTSTDASSCSSIESCVNAALAEEAVYKEVAQAGASSGVVLNISVAANGTKSITSNPSSGLSKLSEELIGTTSNPGGTLGSLKEPKQTGKTVYVVMIETKANTTDGTQSVGRIKCYTNSTAVNAFDASKLN